MKKKNIQISNAKTINIKQTFTDITNQIFYHIHQNLTNQTNDNNNHVQIIDNMVQIKDMTIIINYFNSTLNCKNIKLCTNNIRHLQIKRD